jgi:hypothetical protein
VRQLGAQAVVVVLTAVAWTFFTARTGSSAASAKGLGQRVASSSAKMERASKYA